MTQRKIQITNKSGPGPTVRAVGFIRGLTPDVTRRLHRMLPYLALHPPETRP